MDVQWPNTRFADDFIGLVNTHIALFLTKMLCPVHIAFHPFVPGSHKKEMCIFMVYSLNNSSQ